MLILFMWSLRNSLGYLEPPNEDLWAEIFKNTENGRNNYKGGVIVYVIWSVWLIHIYVFFVIFMNLLIAIIS